MRRLQGLLVLAALALLGWELAALAGLGRQARFERVDLRGQDLEIQIFAPGVGTEADWTRPRVVMCRATTEFDPLNSLLYFPEVDTTRVVPRNAQTILVAADRQVAVLRTPLHRSLIENLRKMANSPSPPEALEAWLSAQISTGATPELRDFLRGP